MGHSALICASCHTEVSLSAAHDAAADTPASMRCPDCRGRDFGI
ncbi:small CPxCG-related zinc finger protein [Natronomonas moolapensis 8.8.11]|uniref:Small CPxCG-related zinc finger protein n=1 Tax=Natronomonas moolapensis (strain DSM 18674 / CECT 7526 / JCM 14361 / 8.8.11) TaxID=268739 RepID=M1XNY4_NATM8|nr:hypothetical protein [Natronomonas moolapensis]CCQ35717.1 small CPxCG-related zinc finger protein [Natronomonas moolapensis 8.8.11]